PAILGGARHHVEHFRRQIVGDDFAHMRRDVEGDMAATAPEVEHAGVGPPAYKRRERGEILTLRVHGALQIGGGARTELTADQARMAFRLGHGYSVRT